MAGPPLTSGCWLLRLIRSAQLQLTRMADPLSELPQDTGYLPAHSHVAMIGVAGSHENSARMTRTIYNALVNRGHIMTRRTHHYSHNVQADASCASRHSRRRIRSWLYATSVLSERERCWSRLPSACIRDGKALVHGPLHNAHSAFSCTYLCTCICPMQLPGHRRAPHCRETDRRGAVWQLPDQAARSPSRPGRPRLGPGVITHRELPSRVVALSLKVQSLARIVSKQCQRVTFRMDLGLRSASGRPVPGELTPTRSRARVAGPGPWPPP